MRAILFALLVAACTGSVGYTVSTPVAYGPDLVYVAPGVQVIADYDVPVFFVDGFYWRWYGGGWYRSSYHTGGWVYASPPPALLRVPAPHTYVHYRPHGWVPRRNVVVRDHRR